MSTRGFVTIVIDGQEKTVFNHFDSYPSGLGHSVLSWLRDGAVNFTDLLAERARELKMLPRDTPEDLEYAQAEVNARRAVYDLKRDVTRLLELGVAVDDGDFPFDSLWAEYGYVIDLDEMKFEVYRGFQTAPHSSGRFASRHGPVTEHRSKPYYPVALVKSWPLSALPTDNAFSRWLEEYNTEEDAKYEAEHTADSVAANTESEVTDGA